MVLLLHETADLRILRKNRDAPSQSPLRAPLCHAAELGIVSAHGQFRACCASPEASGGTLPHTVLPTPEAKECSCEVDPRRSISSKPSDCFHVVQPFANNLSDTKRGIERNDFFIVLKAEVFGRELDSIGGLVGVHIDL